MSARSTKRNKQFTRACAFSTAWMPDLPAPVRNSAALRHALIVASVAPGYLNYLRAPRPDAEPESGWVVAAIAKNEGRDLGEWIEFYLDTGASRIALFDNGSTDDTAQIAQRYANRGVDYYYLPGTVRQLDAYNQALRLYRGRYRYLAALDCDEFLYCEGDTCARIDELFHPGGRGDVGGLGVNQLVFGSSGFDARPEGGVLRNYLRRGRDAQGNNALIKTVCMPTRTLAFVNPHYALYRRGYVCVDAVGREFQGPKTDFGLTEALRINHYFTKSRQDWVEKVGRGKADMLEPRKLTEFASQDKNDVFDDRILRRLGVAPPSSGEERAAGAAD